MIRRYTSVRLEAEIYEMWALELGPNPGSTMCQLGDLEQVTGPLCASFGTSVNKDKNKTFSVWFLERIKCEKLIETFIWYLTQKALSKHQ